LKGTLGGNFKFQFALVNVASSLFADADQLLLEEANPFVLVDSLSFVCVWLNEFTVAADQFVLADTSTSTTFNVDPYTGDLVVKSDYDTTSSLYGNAAFGNAQVFTSAWGLDQDDATNDITLGYTDYGTKVTVDGGVATAVVPENQLYLQMFVGGSSSSTSTTVTGSTFTLTADGQVDSNSDTGLSAQLISHDVTGGSTGTSMTPAAWNVANNQLVWLDSQAPNTPLIVVGGYMVNSLAKNVGMEDLVTKAGDWVAGSASNGNIYVAGFTKDDTASAAKELIAAIENMN